MAFLSTPSARRATVQSPGAQGLGNISIHALREEGDQGICCRKCNSRNISIHALREEGDNLWPGPVLDLRQFLSTPSARRATWKAARQCASRYISIHALREEGDVSEVNIYAVR